MSTHANRVKMTVTSVASSGTGTITLNAASTGFRSFATAYGANATVDILITEGDTWEIARNCTYTHSGTTVSRGTLENSSTGSAVAFTADAVVSVIATAGFGNSVENLAGAWGALNGENSITTTATAVIGRLNVCSGTSANYEVALPAVSGQAGKYIGVQMAPGLTKLVNVTVGADAVTKTGTVTGSTTQFTAGAGTCSTSGSSTTLTGSGTAFDTALRVGDTLYINNQTTPVYVDAIASATSLTMSAARTVVASTPFSYVKTGIVGSGTSFTTEYSVGDGFTVGSDTREIVYIKSDTTLGLDRPFDTAPSGSAHGLTTTKIDGEYNRIMWAKETALLYCDGSTWTKMAGKSIAMAAGIYLDTTQSISANTTTKASCATVNFDSTGLQADTTNYRLKINRTGTYQLSGVVRFNNPGATARCFSMFFVSNVQVLAGECPSVAGTYPGPFITAPFELQNGSVIDLRGETSASGSGFYSSSSKETQILCVEVPQW